MTDSAEEKRLTRRIAAEWLKQQETLAWGGDVPDDEAIELSLFAELESGVAGMLVNSPAYCLSLGGLRSLSRDDALALKTFRGEEVHFEGIETLSPEVEKIVAQFRASVDFHGGPRRLRTKALARRLADGCRPIFLRDCNVSEAAASVFAEKRVTIYLSSQDGLSPKVRKILVEGGCEINSYKTGVIQKEDVKGFGVFKTGLAGRLVFLQATGISPAAAEELGGYPGEKIKFEQPVTISGKAATGISRFPGRLKLCQLNQLSDKAAATLASMTVEVSHYSTRAAALPNVAMSKHGIVVVKDKSITVESIRNVLEVAHLHFSQLTAISLPIAELLAERHRGTLTFFAVRTISPEVAEVLSRHQGGIAFDGFERLTPHVAGKLSALNGFLAFRGLRSLPPSVAQELARHKGRLILDGLESLPSSTAAGLQEHTGDLSLTRLKTMSVKAAEALTKKPGTKILTALQSLDAMLLLLEKDNHRVVAPYSLDEAGQFV